jgi:hypothetical protein
MKTKKQNLKQIYKKDGIWISGNELLKLLTYCPFTKNARIYISDIKFKRKK